MAPAVPPRFSSVLPAADREAISTLVGRSVSASSAFSSLSAASSTEDFLQAKTESLAADIAANNKIKDAFYEARERRAIAENDFKEAVGNTEVELAAAERELVVIKRQKKIIIDDMDEVMPKHQAVSDAYIETITNRIMAATGHQKAEPFKQKVFRHDVLAYYGAERTTDKGKIEKYCHLTGWQPAKDVKCAHIVPKSLQSDELAYLFGVRETMLAEPRNGLVLNHTVEGALDNGEIVFIPDKPTPGTDIVWRCVLIDKSDAPNIVISGTRWGDIDGKELKFLTANRPARRYLYLRYVITCIYQRRMGNSEMLNQALRRADVQGYMWATPGPYLRKSMLVALARKVSDTFLPEAFYGTSTFTDADGCPNRGAEAEEDLAMGLGIRVRDAFDEARERGRADEETGGESDEDGDEA